MVIVSHKPVNDFLPENYEVPSSSNQYMKFLPGENRFRILSSPIVGNEFWLTTSDGKPKPIRRRLNEKISLDELEHKDSSDVRHFWAMPVLDYADSRIKILEITQKRIQRAIKELSKDKDWGTPLLYDIVVNKKGEGMETEYSVIPKPKKPLDEPFVNAWLELKSNGFDLEALFSGGDPFANNAEIIPADESEPEEDIDLTPFD
jgi:hypothetical protein